LNQPEPGPILVTGDVEISGVGKRGDWHHFSVYLDLLFVDGTSEWAVTQVFDPFLPGKQKIRLEFDGPKAISKIFFHLFSGSTGVLLWHDVKLRTPTKVATDLLGIIKATATPTSVIMEFGALAFARKSGKPLIDVGYEIARTKSQTSVVMVESEADLSRSLEKRELALGVLPNFFVVENQTTQALAEYLFQTTEFWDMCIVWWSWEDAQKALQALSHVVSLSRVTWFIVDSTQDSQFFDILDGLPRLDISIQEVVVTDGVSLYKVTLRTMTRMHLKMAISINPPSYITASHAWYQKVYNMTLGANGTMSLFGGTHGFREYTFSGITVAALLQAGLAPLSLSKLAHLWTAMPKNTNLFFTEVTLTKGQLFFFHPGPSSGDGKGITERWMQQILSGAVHKDQDPEWPMWVQAVQAVSAVQAASNAESVSFRNPYPSFGIFNGWQPRGLTPNDENHQAAVQKSMRCAT